MHELCEKGGQNFILLWLIYVRFLIYFDEDRCVICSKIFYIPLLFVHLTVFLFQCVRQIIGCKERHRVCCLQICDNPRGFLVKSLLASIFDEITCELIHKTSI